MLALEPELDFLTLDYLAEVSMSILALQRSRDPKAGWPRDFLDVLRSITPYWLSGGRCRVITNAGGLNPLGCARACGEALRQAGCAGRTIAVISGDDVLDLVRTGGVNDELLKNMDTGRPIADVRDRLLTANAYLGAQPVAAALQSGADLVITGRLADPSLTLAACAHWFGWKWDDWDRLAGGTIAGHLIECGTQLTGGIATDWLDTPDVERIGFPIAEVAADGSCVVTKPRGSGGRVCEADGQGATRLRDRRSGRLSVARRDRLATFSATRRRRREPRWRPRRSGPAGAADVQGERHLPGRFPGAGATDGVWN